MWNFADVARGWDVWLRSVLTKKTGNSFFLTGNSWWTKHLAVSFFHGEAPNGTNICALPDNFSSNNRQRPGPSSPGNLLEVPTNGPTYGGRLHPENHIVERRIGRSDAASPRRRCGQQPARPSGLSRAPSPPADAVLFRHDALPRPMPPRRRPRRSLPSVASENSKPYLNLSPREIHCSISEPQLL